MQQNNRRFRQAHHALVCIHGITRLSLPPSAWPASAGYLRHCLGSRVEPPKPLRLLHRRFYGAVPRKDNRTTSCCTVVSCCSIKRGILSCMEAKQSFLGYIFQSVQFTINQSIYQNVLIRTGQVCTLRKRLHGTRHLFLFFFLAQILL